MPLFPLSIHFKMMTENEAIELLKKHSYVHNDLDDPKLTKGFLGMLRPFTGGLYRDNFHELMQILQVLKQRFLDTTVDREIMPCFWGICHFARVWGVDEGEC